MTQNSINNRASDFTVDNLFLDGNTLSSTNANGDIVLAPNGSGSVSVTAAPIVPSTDRADSLGSATNSWDNVYCDGVSFDDGSNILANYTTTTSFTPSLTFGGASTGITYGTQSGSYTRIGQLIWISVNIVLTNKGSSTGSASVAGLPFTSSGACIFPLRWSLVNLAAAYTAVQGILGGSATTVDLQQAGDNNAFIALTDADFSNTSSIFFSGVYRTS